MFLGQEAGPDPYGKSGEGKSKFSEICNVV